MNLHPHHQLKPLELSPSSHSGKSATSLMPADFTGVVSHRRRAAQQQASPLRSSHGATQHDQLIDQTKRWVAQTFYGTLMKQMRDSPFKSKMFEGGRGGQAFGSMYDQKLIDHMGRGAGMKLVSAIVRKIEARNAKAAYAKQMPAAARAISTTTASSRDAAAREDRGEAGHPPRDYGENPFTNMRAHVATRG